MPDAKRRANPPPDDGPSDEDLQAFGGVTRACPECKSEVYDEAELCWKCGHAFSGEPKPMPRWVIAVAIVVVLAFLVAIFSNLF